MLSSLHIGRVVICFYKRVSSLSSCHMKQAQNRFLSDTSWKIPAEGTDCYVEVKNGKSNTYGNGPNEEEDCYNDLKKHRSCTLRDYLNGGVKYCIDVKTSNVKYDSLNNNKLSVIKNICNDCWCWKGPITIENDKSYPQVLVTSDKCKTSFKISDTCVHYLNKDQFHDTYSCFIEQRHKSFLITGTNKSSGNNLYSETNPIHNQICRYFSKVTDFSYNQLNSFNKNSLNKVIMRNISRKDYEFPDFNEDDISETFQRGDGPGGQATAKTSNCCVLTHHPTGIVIRCHETRSLEKNRARARIKLREQLDVYYNGEKSFLALQQKEGSEHRSKKRDRSRKRLEIKKAWKENIQKDTNAEKDNHE